MTPKLPGDLPTAFWGNHYYLLSANEEQEPADAVAEYFGLHEDALNDYYRATCCDDAAR